MNVRTHIEPDVKANHGSNGFTLLELVVAVSLFAVVIVDVLADQEKSLKMAGDARALQVVRYLAQAKMDQIVYDPSQLGDSNSGDFSDMNTDYQNFDAYTWDEEIQQIVAVGTSQQSSDTYLFPDDANATPLTNANDKPVTPRYVRRVTLTVSFAPDGTPRPDLSVKVVTYIPPDPNQLPQATQGQ